MEFFNADFFSKHGRTILWVIGGVVVTFLIFHAGLVVGSHQGLRPRADGTERGFRPSLGFGFGMPTLPDGYMPRGHGAVGVITSVALPTMMIEEPDGDSETVLLATTTLIDSASYAASSSALTAGMHVIVFGDPDESVERINAKVIHVLP